MASIELTNIVRDFPEAQGRGRWRAIEDVSFKVETGEIVGILGPSGCGKSTLLNIVAGLDEGYGGRCLIDGVPVSEAFEKGFRVAYVFQQSRLLPWKTVRQNIEFVLKAAGRPQSTWQERIDAILRMVELSDFADFFPAQLSGGMQQRASIARAFAIEPDILLLDEPFSALDELTARRLRQSLLEIWREFRTTILFVSHNAMESTFLGDRVMIMGQGPGGRIREKISLAHLSRPRTYDDVGLFDASREVITAMQQYVDDLK